MDFEPTVQPDLKVEVKTKFIKDKEELARKVEADKSRVEQLITEFNSIDNPALGLIRGLPEGARMDVLVGRAKQRLGEETDILRNQESSGVDIFASSLSNQRLKVRGGRTKIISGKRAAREMRAKKLGGYADYDTMTAVVLDPHGGGRNNLLAYAVDGDKSRAHTFSTTIHEATHLGFAHENVLPWDNNTIKLGWISLLLPPAVATVFTIKESLMNQFVSDSELQVGLGIVSIALASMTLSYGVEAYKRIRNVGGETSRVINELLAKVSPCDIGTAPPPQARDLAQGLQYGHSHYERNWKAAVRELGKNGEEELSKLVADVSDRYMALTGLGVSAFEISRILGKRKNVGNGKKPRSWIAALDKLIQNRCQEIYGDQIDLPDLKDMGRLRIDHRRYAMRKALLEEMKIMAGELKDVSQEQVFKFSDSVDVLSGKHGDTRTWARVDVGSGRVSLWQVDLDLYQAPGETITDISQLGTLASKMIDNFSDSDWQKMENLIRVEQFPDFSDINSDASDGQLSMMVFLEVLKRIPKRWGLLDHISGERKAWNEIAHQCLDAARDNLARAKKAKDTRRSRILGLPSWSRRSF